MPALSPCTRVVLCCPTACAPCARVACCSVGSAFNAALYAYFGSRTGVEWLKSWSLYSGADRLWTQRIKVDFGVNRMYDVWGDGCISLPGQLRLHSTRLDAEGGRP